MRTSAQELHASTQRAAADVEKGLEEEEEKTAPRQAKTQNPWPMGGSLPAAARPALCTSAPCTTHQRGLPRDTSASLEDIDAIAGALSLQGLR